MAVFQDRNGEWLKGEYSYRLRVPPDVPASLFWSAVCYDNRTRTLIDTDQQKATVGKKTEGLHVNEIWTANSQTTANYRLAVLQKKE